jgi:putative sterol carrier protein
MATLEEVTNRLRENVGEDSGLGATVKFVFDEGVIYVDGASSPNSVSNEDKDADCTIKVALDDFVSMAQGDLDPTVAFMSGKLKVEGDMGVAMKLGSVLRS